MSKLVNYCKLKNQQLNIGLMSIPFLIVLILATLITIFPDGSNRIILDARDFFTGTIGFYYILIGIAFVIIALYIIFSRVGKIKLGGAQDKKMNTLTWAIMVFTATMAADLLFFAFLEWTFYYDAYLHDPDAALTQTQMLRNAMAIPLFHFGVIPLLFYLVPAVAYAFVFYVKKRRKSQKISEACRPILGKYTTKALGKIIDLLAVIGLLLGTATTFAVATPLIIAAFSALTGVPRTNLLTVITLIVVVILYSISALWGLKSMTIIAKIGVISFCLLSAVFFIGGNPRFIIELGISGAGYMFSNFVQWSTWTDPARATSFPQNFTIFYWAYWLAWAVATPLFIAKISKGRTVREMLVGGVIFKLAGAFMAFIIFGGFGLFHQTSGNMDVAYAITGGADSADVIISIIRQLPLYHVALAIIIVAMILFYVSTFDSLAYVMAAYSYKKLDIDKPASKKIKIYWSIIFITLPIALIFVDTALAALTALSIIGAFPTSIILIMVIISFFKGVKSINSRIEKKIKKQKRKNDTS